MAADHLTGLLKQIQELESSFGRAQADLRAIRSRAVAEDYRGVLQNARVISETLLRSILVREKDQQPGKATLEQLIPKLYQDGKPSILPQHIVVHIRTIQAWGNVGAHDQGTDLFSGGLEVEKQEANAALNSVVAILSWYKTKYLADGSTPSSAQPRATSEAAGSTTNPPPAPPHASPPPEKKLPIIPIAIAGLVVIGAVGFFALRPKGPGTGPDGPKKGVTRKALDDAYRASLDHPPPDTCKTKEPQKIAMLKPVIEKLEGGKSRGARPQDKQALQMLEATKQALLDTTEFWYLTARAHYFADSQTSRARSDRIREAAEKSIELCKGFAAPYNLLGNLGLSDKDYAFAKLSYARALEIQPEYLSPRFNLGAIAVASGELDAGIDAFDMVIKGNKNYAPAYHMRATAYVAKGENASARKDLEALIALEPRTPKYHVMLAKVLTALGEAQLAQKSFCRAKLLGSKTVTPDQCPAS